MMPSMMVWSRCLIFLGLLTVQVLVMRPSWWMRAGSEVGKSVDEFGE